MSVYVQIVGTVGIVQSGENVTIVKVVQDAQVVFRHRAESREQEPEPASLLRAIAASAAVRGG